MATASVQPPTGPQVDLDIDQISLQQALRDFEGANARVLELTHKLVEAERRWRDLAHQAEHLRLRLAALEAPAASAAPAPAPLPQRAARRLWRLGRRVLGGAP